MAFSRPDLKVITDMSVSKSGIGNIDNATHCYLFNNPIVKICGFIIIELRNGSKCRRAFFCFDVRLPRRVNEEFHPLSFFARLTRGRNDEISFF